MGTTAKYAWPYPELTDPPDGAGQIKALATAIDTTVSQQDACWSSFNVTNNAAIADLGNAYCAWTVYAQSPVLPAFTIDGTVASKLVCAVKGVYLITFKHRVDAAASRATGYASASLEHAYGTNCCVVHTPQGGATVLTLGFTHLRRISLGDTLGVKLYNATGGNITPNLTSWETKLDIVRVGTF